MKKVSEGELAGKYTNHLLRATSASRLFAANVPEKVIQKSGHGALLALEHIKKKQQKHN